MSQGADLALDLPGPATWIHGLSVPATLKLSSTSPTRKVESDASWHPSASA
jgi:hypothetical protein